DRRAATGRLPPRPDGGQARARDRGRHRAGQGDGRALPVAGRPGGDLRPARGRAGGDRGGAPLEARRRGGLLRRRHPRRGRGRRNGGGHLRRRPTHRAGEQRGGQFHQPHGGPVTARVRRDRQHRDARDLLRHPRSGQALDSLRLPGQRGEHHRHLGAERRAVRGAFRDEQGSGARDDQITGDRVGPPRHPPERDRPGRDTDGRDEQAAQPRRGAGRASARGEPDGARGADAGAHQPGDVPAVGRLPVAQRRVDHDGRRRGAGDRRQLLRPARMGRRAMGRSRRGDPGAEREGPGATERV
ncbi:MAG: Gluconate 5-dehydrogenase, partial [uncultured Sphingomonadaceae bacterium]